MPKTKNEPSKKHGDTLEELIERTGDEPRDRDDPRTDDDSAQLDSDDEDDEDTDERRD
jgi:hypothetical protein